MKVLIFCLIASLLFCVVVACSRGGASSQEIVVGGIYASKGEEGVYRVSKVLAVDRAAVHVRLYKNKFKSLPQNLDPSALSLGGLGDPEGFGVGHVPIAKDGFLKESTLLQKVPVTDEELEGYKYYLQQTKK